MVGFKDPDIYIAGNKDHMRYDYEDN